MSFLVYLGKLRIIILPVMAPNKDLRSPELSSQLFHIIGRSFMTIEAWRLRRNLRSVLTYRMNVQLWICALRSLTVPPKPMRSGQTTRKPNSNSIGIWFLQPIERSGQPWSFTSRLTIHNYNNTIAEMSAHTKKIVALNPPPAGTPRR